MKTLALFTLVSLTACSRGHDGLAITLPGLSSPTATRTINVLAGGQSNMTLYLGTEGTPVFFKQALRQRGIDAKVALTAISGSSQQDWAIGGALYNNLIEKGKQLGAVDVLIWWQGEAEGATMVVPLGEAQPIALAQAWGQNFTEFVKAVRRDLNNPTLQVIFCQIGPNPGGLDSWEEVKHQQSMIYMNNVSMIKTDDQDFAGWFHTNEEGYRMIGARMAARWLETN